jgi:hypothetical protein
VYGVLRYRLASALVLRIYETSIDLFFRRLYKQNSIKTLISMKDKMLSSTSSTSSGASTPNHFFPPAITVTNASIEHYSDYEPDIRCSAHPYHQTLGQRSSYGSMACELTVPVQPVRRLSEPSPNPMTGVGVGGVDSKRSTSPGSQSCCSPMLKKIGDSGGRGRKFSLEMVPRIQINTVGVPGDPNTTPNPCKKAGVHYLNPMSITGSSDRTISESNLSTSGYSSLSSPGISRYYFTTYQCSRQS